MQVVTSIQGLDLDVFPFGAYDEYGRLKVDPAVTDSLKKELRNVLEQPVWRELFEQLALFDNPGYDCFAVGYRASRRGVKIVAFRQLQATSSPDACARFHGTIAEQRLPAVRERAGKQYIVDPHWIEVVRKVLSIVGGGLDAWAGVDGAQPAKEPDPAEVAAAIGWQAALGIVLDILEIANTIGRSPRVDCTVVWRLPTWSSVPKSQLPRWSPISTVATSSGCACTGVLWDRVARDVWHWTANRPWPAGFPFTPHGIWQSLYPSGQLVDAEA
jgi:hypothetical protein